MVPVLDIYGKENSSYHHAQSRYNTEDEKYRKVNLLEMALL